eukprot:CAMPEP_0175049906 /NCGR_PEP_ID=MMETSP0052_2-20121109/6975_1 /TAXON_ID=51329 ORGANISM="Polytomella parva, Strain SAG 63-3" /NCGR_SAMPLE_ID=MMETSP0052_2 /ASSEMBLY_ACC=CAM_ASM_000194 /LENGTH=604 /DNA_ID=CAMNT_0016314073 /DNA_START=195 /DNA_END=2009 /DNA_ORIENTATION=-
MNNPLVSYFVSNFKIFWDIVGPGGKLHPAYFLEHKGHLAIEGILLLLIIYLILQHSYKISPSTERPLTDKEVDELCREWVPEPLVASEPEDIWTPPVVESEKGVFSQINGRPVLNLGSQDYLCLSNHAEVKDEGFKAIVKYGVGSCGPRGFYGTVDVHLDLEKEIAAFMGTENCIIYSYDIVTIASIIPAFAGRLDIIIVDELCNYAIQSGCTVSRARVFPFKHNDMADLERVLKEVEAAERKARKPLCRKYIVVEGIFSEVGDFAPLDKLYEIKEQYKYRLIVDESVSFGTVGPTGRGSCELFGLKPGQVELISASMSNALGSAGGFCAGDAAVIEHQRLSGLGYCFSASLPPYLTITASAALRKLSTAATAATAFAANSVGGQAKPPLTGEGDHLRGLLHGVSGMLHSELSKVKGFRVLSDPRSPVQILALSKEVSDASLKGIILGLGTEVGVNVDAGSQGVRRSLGGANGNGNGMVGNINACVNKYKRNGTINKTTTVTSTATIGSTIVTTATTTTTTTKTGAEEHRRLMELDILAGVAKRSMDLGFLVVPVRHSKLYRSIKLPPTLRISARVGVTASQIDQLAAALRESLNAELAVVAAT